MNTTGIQNYLSNVFHPIYFWDTTASNFTPKLELTNIDTYSGNTVSVFNAAIGDVASNVYVGSNAGNPFTAIGGCSNVTALGYGAGSNISNVSNSVFLGWYAGAGTSNSTDVIAVGKSAGGVDGSQNIFIGTGTKVVGTGNTLIGHFIAPTSTSNQIRIGYSNQIPIAADHSKNWVGLGGILTPTNTTYANVDISGGLRVNGNLGIQITPGTRTLDVNGNFRARDASMNSLDFSNGLTTSSAGFASIQSNITMPDNWDSVIGPIRKGIINVCAIDQTTSANRAATVYFAYDSNAATALSSTSSGGIFINISNTDLKLNTTGIGDTRTYNYAITYFPLP